MAGARRGCSSPARRSSSASRARRSAPRTSAARSVHGRNGVAHLRRRRRRAGRRARRAALLAYLPAASRAAPLPLCAPRDPAPGDPGDVAARARPRGLRRARRRRAARRRRRRCSSWRRAGRATSSSASARVEGRRSASSPTSRATSAAASTPTRPQKGAWFVGLCDRYGIPLVVLVDTPGFLPGRAPGAGRGHPPRRGAAAGVRLRDRPAGDGHAAPGLRRGPHRHELPRPRSRPDAGLAGCADRRHGRRARPSSSSTAGTSPRARTPARWPTPTRPSTCPSGAAAAGGFVDEVIAPDETRERLVCALEAGR